MAFAGAASAEIAVSGSAEMGIAGGSDTETQFVQSVDFRLKGTGTTDGGLEFGVQLDIDDALDMALKGYDSVNNMNGEFADYTVWIKGAFGNLTMGDTDGAFDWALTEVQSLSSITDDHTTHGGFSGNAGLDGLYDGQIARYDYSFGAFGVALSAELDDTAGSSDVVWGAGVKWSGEMGAMDVGLGLGYQSSPDNSILGISGKIASNGFNATLNYADLDGYNSHDSHTAIGVGYTTGALSMEANYGIYNNVKGTADVKGWGAAVNYDLGGGAVVEAGYGKTIDGESTWSAGLAMSF